MLNPWIQAATQTPGASRAKAKHCDPPAFACARKVSAPKSRRGNHLALLMQAIAKMRRDKQKTQ